ncbi:MAG TPA: hypothetical protein VNA22_05780 [Pyrinomonadaceae bacterium]|nr:hypothetical protein [Pyrinomonadaceae bacterium]
MSQLLINGGFLPQLAELYKGKGSTIFTRKNGLIFTVCWFIFFLMMLPAFFAIAGEGEAAGVSAVFGVFSSMIFLIISLAVLKRAPKPYELSAYQMSPRPPQLYANPQMTALPPQQSQPASTYMPPEGTWRAPDTGEFAKRPSSVTEGTTKLLQKDE